ncbi:MAG: hypothetical protein HDR44_04125, partial [Allobaculum sp.]|nr:hypothetical protein [Allobaculum sp.]
GSHMNKEEVKKEIESMVAAGFGGAEIVPVSIAGGDGEGEIDWGSDQWKEITKYILEVAGENNFTIDFTLTPAWPLALPTIEDVDDPKQGAQMEMDGAWVDGITKENSFHGELPISTEAIEDAQKVNGRVELVGITVAKYQDKENKVLDYNSAKTIEATKNEDGTYTTEFTPTEDGEYVLYAWYQHPSGNQKYGNNQVDHYSKYGAQMIIDYWEDVLIPYYGDDWKNVRSLFVDSLEFETHLDWTYDLQKQFEEMYGYDITPYLPAIYDSSDEMSAIGNYMGDPVPTFTFDKNSTQLKNEFHEFLTTIYIENNIIPLQEFCARNGVTLRYQTSYGKNLDLLETAMYPDIPETESLYGNDYIDFYRLQSGAVHAMDKAIYSMETAAEWTETWNDKKDDGNYGTRGNGENNSGNYEQTFQDHIWHDQRAFAAGVNQVVFHGYPYNGQYEEGVVEGTQWPGFTGFESHRWSNSWGERQPNWMFADDYLDFIARNQLILRQGTPKVDLAIYHHSYYETIDFWGPDKVFNTTNLEQNGYSYDFIDPSILDLEVMSIQNKRLDADGSAYKALIFNEVTTIPEATLKKLIEFAKQDFPIFFVGNTDLEKAYETDADITDLLKELMAYESVHTVKDLDSLTKALQDQEVLPDASYSDQTLLTNHRQDENTDYYFVYNYGDANNYKEVQKADEVKTEITFVGQGNPYQLDAWTGEITALEKYSQEDGKYIIPIELVANDSTIICISKEELATPSQAQEAMKGEVILKDFSLEVESWTKGESVTDTKKTIIEVGQLDHLKSWDQIKELENVSGVGVYTTTFDLPNDYQEGQQVYIHLGHVKDAFGVMINGHEVNMNQVSGSGNISDFVKAKDNEVQITVATSLLNAILKENENIKNEDGRVLDDRAKAAYGLVNDVIISGQK